MARSDWLQRIGSRFPRWISRRPAPPETPHAGPGGDPLSSKPPPGSPMGGGPGSAPPMRPDEHPQARQERPQLASITSALAALAIGQMCTSLRVGRLEAAWTAPALAARGMRLAIEHAPTAIAIFDTEMRYVAASEGYIAAYRLAPETVRSVVGRSHYELFPEIPERWREIHRRVLAGETLSADEDRFDRRDGTTDWVRWEMTPWLRPDRSVGGAILFGEVITARKEAEAALLENRARLQMALEAAEMGVWDWDITTDRLTWNARQFVLFGIDPASGPPTGAQALARVHPEDLLTLQSVIGAVLHTEQNHFVFEFRVMLPDGTIRWLGAQGRPIRDATGRAVRMIGLNYDLTARHEAEAAVAKSERWLRAVTDTMPEIVWAASPSGGNDYVNLRWSELTGLTAEQSAGEGWRKAVHPDDAEDSLRLWAKATAEGTPYVCEHRLRTADGGYRWMLSRAMPVRNADGRIERWFGSSTDIEDLRQARELLARDRAELGQLVENRTAELQDTQTRLAHAQHMEALGQLAGGIAHDFNNVLQTLQSAAAIIRRHAGDAVKIERLSDLIEEATGRGASVTRRLLAFARRSALHTEPVDVAELVVNLREILVHTLGSGIRIDVAVREGLPPLLADKAQLEAVLVNLATNARDAMAGQGVLSLAAAADTVAPDRAAGHPLRLKPGHYIRLSVRDTGTGMDAATLARASEPFFTTKPVGKGTGLGLAMARGFAEQSGGALEIESAPGRGTTVRLWLPTADTEHRALTTTETDPPRTITPASPRLPTDEEPLLASLAE